MAARTPKWIPLKDITPELWRLMKADFETTKASLGSISRRYNVPAKAIKMKSVADKWEPYSERLRMQNDQAIGKMRAIAKTTKNPREAYAAMELAGELQATVVERHKHHIAKAYAIADDMLGELKAQAMSRDDMIHIAELLAMAQGQTGEVSPADVQMKIASWTKLLGLGNRVDTLSKLASAMKTLVSLERQAHGVADVAPKGEDETKQPAITANDAARRIAFALLMGAPESKN